jgi:hypothetical protein
MNQELKKFGNHMILKFKRVRNKKFPAKEIMAG